MPRYPMLESMGAGQAAQQRLSLTASLSGEVLRELRVQDAKRVLALGVLDYIMYGLSSDRS